MANKIVLKYDSMTTFGYFWLLSATKRVSKCCTFVSDKAGEALVSDL